MNGHFGLYALIVVMVAFWSGNYIVGKIALREFPPLLLSGLRISLASVLISPLYWWQSRTRPDPFRREDVPTLLYLGVFGVTLNQVFFVVGLSRTSVAHSAIIIGTIPVQVLILAGLVGQEAVTLRKMAGMAVALAGVVCLKFWESQPAAGTGPTLLGDLFIFLAGLSFALFTVFGKRVTAQHTSVTMNTFAYMSGALALAPLTAWEALRFPVAHVSPAGWASLTYMALFPSVICYLIYYYALTHIPASRVSAFSYLQPVLAILMGCAFLREELTAAEIAAGAVIFAGVYITERAR